MLVVQFFTTYLPKPHIKNTGKYLSHNNIHGDQKENKSRVPSHLLFYLNVCLSLIVHICMVKSILPPILESMLLTITILCRNRKVFRLTTARRFFDISPKNLLTGVAFGNKADKSYILTNVKCCFYYSHI
jgi:hypothetical protein